MGRLLTVAACGFAVGCSAHGQASIPTTLAFAGIEVKRINPPQG